MWKVIIICSIIFLVFVGQAQAAHDNQAFVDKAIRIAKRIQEKYHIPVSATVSMAIYESSYGRSVLAREHHNYFGLKANEWDGPTARVSTVDSGTRHKAEFRVYESFEEGFYGFAEFLMRPRYKAAFEAENSEQFIERILRAGYCPDKKYLREVKSIIARYDLKQYDKTFENVFLFTNNRG